MSSKDWQDAWERGEIGFHQSHTNAFLEQFGETVWGQTPGRVLVPLCGKSLDMVHLAETADAVVGIEFVDQAVQEFFAEHDLAASVDVGPPSRYEAGPFTIFAADFFSITPEHTGRIDSVFDRASIVALDADTRVRYANHLATLLPAGAVVLMVTFTYDQTQMQGPPFSVTNDEVHAIFGDAFTIDVLDSHEALNDAMRSRGVTSFMSTAYKLVRR